MPLIRWLSMAALVMLGPIGLAIAVDILLPFPRSMLSGVVVVGIIGCIALAAKVDQRWEVIEYDRKVKARQRRASGPS